MKLPQSAPEYCNYLSPQHHYYKAVCHCSSALIYFKGIHKLIFTFETLAEQWCVSKINVCTPQHSKAIFEQLPTFSVCN